MSRKRFHSPYLTPSILALFLLAIVASRGECFAQNLLSKDKGDSVYRSDRVTLIEIKIAPDDWQDLRISQRRDGFGYGYYKADVAINSQWFRSVGLRKKGNLGSVVSTRPSLKINFDKYTKNQKFEGTDMLTLNNNNQDPTNAHQFLVYSFIERAGGMAPRCGFARVIVNGEDLGIYTNVESIRKPFLKRVFGNSKGNLYEGIGGDFNRRGFSRIAHKRGDDEDLLRLHELGRVLETRRSIPLEQFQEFLNIESFITQWACEVLIGHADSYSNNRNNWYAYQDPETDQLHFIPWGADAAFRDPSPYITYPVPKSVKAKGLLCQRLWELPEIRDRYRTEMLRLLNSVWDKKDILNELDRIADMTLSHQEQESYAFQFRSNLIKQFVTHRRSEVMPELRSPMPDWPSDPSRGSTSSARNFMELKGTFTAQVSHEDPDVYSTISVFDPWGDELESVLGKGKAQLQYSANESSVNTFKNIGAVAFADRKGYRKGYPAVQIVAKNDNDQSLWNLRFSIDPHQTHTARNAKASKFSSGSILDVGAFVTKLAKEEDPVSAFLYGELSESVREQMSEYLNESRSGALKLRSQLTHELNSIIETITLYTASRFANVALRKESSKLLNSHQNRSILNKLLIEDAYPDEISRYPNSLAINLSAVLGNLSRKLPGAPEEVSQMTFTGSLVLDHYSLEKDGIISGHFRTLTSAFPDEPEAKQRAPIQSPNPKQDSDLPQGPDQNR